MCVFQSEVDLLYVVPLTLPPSHAVVPHLPPPISSRFPNSYQMLGLHRWFIDQLPFVDTDFEREKKEIPKRLGTVCCPHKSAIYSAKRIPPEWLVAAAVWLSSKPERGQGLIPYLRVFVRLHLTLSDFIKEWVTLDCFFLIYSQPTCCMSCLT